MCEFEVNCVICVVAAQQEESSKSFRAPCPSWPIMQLSFTTAAYIDKWKLQVSEVVSS